MELSSEGLAIAAATRDAIAAKKRHLEELAKQAEIDKKPGSNAVKKPHLNRPPPVCSHEVAIPEGFDPSKITLDEAMHGETSPLQHCSHDRLLVRQLLLLLCYRSINSPHVPGTLQDPILRSGARAKQYPFVLDPFQETAIACLVSGIITIELVWFSI